MKLFSDEIRIDPYSAYEKIRRAGSVVHDVDTDWRYVGRYADVLEVLKNNEIFSNIEVGMEPSLSGADGAQHKEARRIIQPLFKPDRISGLESIIEEISGELASDIKNHDKCEFVASVASVLPARVLALMLGDPCLSPRNTIAYNNAIISTAVDRLRARRGGDAGNAVDSADQIARGEFYLREILERAAARPTGGWVADHLAAEYRLGHISAEQFVDIGLLLIVGATETTTALISTAAHRLAIDQSLQARLRSHPEQIEAFIDECLRFDAPVQRRPRVVMKAVTIGEVTVPKGAMILALIGSANRDPAAFPNPDNFDIDRDSNPGHLSFATGRHVCPGAQLARMEARVLIKSVLRSLPQFRLASPETPVEHPANPVFRGPRRLELAF